MMERAHFKRNAFKREVLRMWLSSVNILRMKKSMYAILIGLIMISSLSLTTQESKRSKWNIPDEYKTMKNPLKKTPENLKSGKESYDRHCAGCHGITGNGDGEKVKQLIEKSVRPSNFKLNEFQSESEGVHFYKTKFGREGMHSFKGKIQDEDIWGIVMHITTFQ
jgi:cytochrome c